MRVITAPTHTIPNDAGGEPFDFVWFVRAMLNIDERFNSSGAAIRAAMRIEKAIGEVSAGMRDFRLQPDDWTLLRDACEAPSMRAYPISPGRRVLPYVDAITSAAEVPESVAA
jgi:hypothetical protein